MKKKKKETDLTRTLALATDPNVIIVSQADRKVPALDKRTGEGFLNHATYQSLSCGCRVMGNGTLPHPLTVKLCPLHEAADSLRLELTYIIEKFFNAALTLEDLDAAKEILAKFKWKEQT